MTAAWEVVVVVVAAVVLVAVAAGVVATEQESQLCLPLVTVAKVESTWFCTHNLHTKQTVPV